ncbi:MAG: DUF2505 domain-containing protein [Candidatus Competibacteraceae bacterium]
MEVKDVHQYKKDVAAVFKFFSDPDAIKTKYESIGARNIELLESSESGGTYNNKTQREVPSEVPGILQKFLGAWNKVVQTEQWEAQADGSRVCKMDIDVVGVPVKVAGKMKLRPEGKGCVNEVSINVTCGIPLIGGKLAEFVGNDTKKNMDAEYDYISKHL